MDPNSGNIYDNMTEEQARERGFWPITATERDVLLEVPECKRVDVLQEMRLKRRARVRTAEMAARQKRRKKAKLHKTQAARRRKAAR